MKWIFVAIVFVVLISGCVEGEQVEIEILSPSELCLSACNDALARGEDLSNGPCLLDPMTERPDWVCDVAHSPREDVDNLPENQCSSFRAGDAGRFVEVTPECALIRAV